MSMMYAGPTGGAFSSKMNKGSTPRGYESGQLSQFTPEQMQLFQQLFSHVGPQSFLSRLASGDQSQFGQMELPALKQFAGAQGGLASRFSGMGAGSRHSSGFQNTANQAAADFAEGLQSQRLGIQNQAIRDLMQLSTQLLGQRPYENFLVPKQKAFWQELLAGLAPGIGTGLGMMGGGAALGGLGALGGSVAGGMGGYGGSSLTQGMFG